ncbi:hypothetical protein ACJRO7_022963 [Eucalyptus globulus]|uniref:BED-type domain-containing protein n=1 Tax=Eucalyptus globulus TaxID=34317 RepID=A0ABD3K9N4_EUCGL
MPREKDPFWQHVTLLNESNSKWRCNFCQQENSGTATRIKAHLAGIARFGINGCEKVGDDVKAEARDRLMPQKVMDSSDKSVSEEGILGNVRAAPTSQSHGSNVEGGTNLQFPLGMHFQITAENGQV